MSSKETLKHVFLKPDEAPEKWVEVKNKKFESTDGASEYAQLNPEQLRKLHFEEMRSIIESTSSSLKVERNYLRDTFADMMGGAPNKGGFKLSEVEVKTGEEREGVFAYLKVKFPNLFPSQDLTQLAYRYCFSTTGGKINALKAGDLVSVSEEGVLTVKRNGSVYYQTEIYPWSFVLSLQDEGPGARPDPAAEAAARAVARQREEEKAEADRKTAEDARKAAEEKLREKEAELQRTEAEKKAEEEKAARLAAEEAVRLTEVREAAEVAAAKNAEEARNAAEQDPLLSQKEILIGKFDLAVGAVNDAVAKDKLSDAKKELEKLKPLAAAILALDPENDAVKQALAGAQAQVVEMKVSVKNNELMSAGTERIKGSVEDAMAAAHAETVAEGLDRDNFGAKKIEFENDLAAVNRAVQESNAVLEGLRNDIQGQPDSNDKADLDEQIKELKAVRKRILDAQERYRKKADEIKAAVNEAIQVPLGTAEYNVRVAKTALENAEDTKVDIEAKIIVANEASRIAKAKLGEAKIIVGTTGFAEVEMARIEAAANEAQCATDDLNARLEELLKVEELQTSKKEEGAIDGLTVAGGLDQTVVVDRGGTKKPTTADRSEVDWMDESSSDDPKEARAEKRAELNIMRAKMDLGNATSLVRELAEQINVETDFEVVRRANKDANKAKEKAGKAYETIKENGGEMNSYAKLLGDMNENVGLVARKFRALENLARKERIEGDVEQFEGFDRQDIRVHLNSTMNPDWEVLNFEYGEAVSSAVDGWSRSSSQTFRSREMQIKPTDVQISLAVKSILPKNGTLKDKLSKAELQADHFPKILRDEVKKYIKQMANGNNPFSAISDGEKPYVPTYEYTISGGEKPWTIRVEYGIYDDQSEAEVMVSEGDDFKKEFSNMSDALKYIRSEIVD